MAGLAARLYRCAITSHRRFAKQQGGEAVGLFDVIHSLDRPKLAAALARAMAESGRKPRLCAGKHRRRAAKSRRAGGRCCRFCRRLPHTARAQHRGSYVPAAGWRCGGPAFALLGKLAASLDLACLSMGMSADYPPPCRWARHIFAWAQPYLARAVSLYARYCRT